MPVRYACYGAVVLGKLDETLFLSLQLNETHQYTILSDAHADTTSLRPRHWASLLPIPGASPSRNEHTCGP